MNDDSLPALYLAADAASNDAQRTLLRSFKCNAALLIAAAAAAVFTTSSALAIVSVLLFVGSLAVYAHGQYREYRAIWYQSRALAESVKTATWRLVMSAEPFAHEDEEENLRAFRTLLHELLTANQSIGKHLAGDWSSHDQITSAMLDVLHLPFDKKRHIYLAHRIDDQRDWYATKSKTNKRQSTFYFVLLCCSYAVALVLLLCRILHPDVTHLPIDVFAVLASTLIGWTQIKRFDELASAYGLTAHEVGIIKSRYDSVHDEQSLGDFVSDAENAFSREHTQWAARRDH